MNPKNVVTGLFGTATSAAIGVVKLPITVGGHVLHHIHPGAKTEPEAGQPTNPVAKAAEKAESVAGAAAQNVRAKASTAKDVTTDKAAAAADKATDKAVTAKDATKDIAAAAADKATDKAVTAKDATKDKAAAAADKATDKAVTAEKSVEKSAKKAAKVTKKATQPEVASEPQTVLLVDAPPTDLPPPVDVVGDALAAEAAAPTLPDVQPAAPTAKHKVVYTSGG